MAQLIGDFIGRTINRARAPPPLYQAVLDNNEAEVRRILETDRTFPVDVNERYPYDHNKTALYAAVENLKNPEIISMLLMAGADVTLRYEEEWHKTVLELARDSLEHPERWIYNHQNEALAQNGDRAIVRRVASQIVDLLEQAQRWTTEIEEELHQAVQENQIEEVQRLIQRGFHDINKLDRHGMTPLMIAVRSTSNPAMVRLLLEAGADVRIPMPEGKSLVQWVKDEEPHWGGRGRQWTILSRLDIGRGERLREILPLLERENRGILRRFWNGAQAASNAYLESRNAGRGGRRRKTRSSKRKTRKRAHA